MFAPLLQKSLGFIELKKNVIDSNLCSLCGSCGLLCEKIRYGNDPYLCETESCVTKTGAYACGTNGCCFDNCPMTSFSKTELETFFFNRASKDEDLGSFLKIISARSTNPEILSIAQNGGTVTSLLHFGLSNNVPNIQKYTGAIITKRKKNWEPEFYLASKSSDLKQAVGSKYSRIPLSSYIRPILRQMKNIIFVGTGCQTTGVRRYQYNFLRNLEQNTAGVFVIGLFCYENFPYHDFNNAIKKTFGIPIEKTIKMDINKGKLFVTTQDNKIFETPVKNLDSIVPEACKFCTNFTAEMSDISIGSIGSESGWNTLIIRTDTGMEFIEETENQGMIETKNNVSIESIRKTITRKKEQSQKIVEKRKMSNQFVPKYD